MVYICFFKHRPRYYMMIDYHQLNLARSMTVYHEDSLSIELNIYIVYNIYTYIFVSQRTWFFF